MKPSILFPLILAGLGLSSVHANNKLKESTFTQVVNDVKVISMADKSQKPATVHEMFKLPDVIRTGPASRAELVAEDKTITRIGANTIFSFDPATRTIDLEKGSLLFHSPKGKGGGTIKTGNATAAVLGTTIMVAATPDGGFKVIVLEGTAKVKLANGQIATLTAGQEVFVLPGSKLSPVITVRLDLLVSGSLLVQGFDNPLPSKDLIIAAIDDQKILIETGKATDTGLDVGHIASIAGVQIVNPEIMPPNFVPPVTVTPPALNEDMIVNASSLDQSHVFPTPTQVQSPAFSGTFVGAFARNISFVEGSQTVDLTPYHSLPNFTFLANGNIDIQNSVHFTGNSESYGDLSLIAAGTITMTPESSLTYSGSGFFIQALGSMSFNAVTFQNYAGLMEVSSGGNLSLRNTSVYGNGALVSAKGNLSLDNSYVTGYGYGERGSVNKLAVTSYGEVVVASGGSMTVNNSSINGNDINISSRAGSITTSGESSFYGNTLNMRAAKNIDINGTYFSFNTINMAAKTIILNNVNFSSYVNVYLQSKIGQLAANPNTGAAPVAGYVNFISNVNYGGDPAQYHVNPSSGTGIFIYPLGGKPPVQSGTGTVARASMKIK